MSWGEQKKLSSIAQEGGSIGAKVEREFDCINIYTTVAMLCYKEQELLMNPRLKITVLLMLLFVLSLLPACYT